jgi:uncharacterized membrane protein YcaP (DUF421 family)
LVRALSPLEATRVSKSRYAILFILIQIYLGRRDPCVDYPFSSVRVQRMLLLLLQTAPKVHQPFFFNGWYDIGRTVTLSVVGFAALIIMLRVSGKRTLSKLNVFDFVFVVACGSVFAATIIEKDVTLLEGMFSLATLIGIQIILAEIAARWDVADRIINGHPALLFSDGKFIPRALKRERITEGEIRAAIREKGITRVEDVDAVVLETDGSLSVSWESKRPGATSLVDAKVPGGQRAAKRST